MKKISILLLFSVICFSGVSQNRATLLKESFDNPVLPAGWTITNQNSNWSVSNSSNAGGSPYELKLYYNPSFNGKTRVVSPVINTTGATDLAIEFIHYLDNYSGSHTIGIETTSDGGTTWNPGWSSVYSSSGARSIAAAISTTDVGSANFQFCLFYQGYSYNINNWYFDNFELYSIENIDAALTFINNPINVAADYHKADFTFANRGAATINSLEMEYQFGDLAPVVETFTSLDMESLTTKTLSFTGTTFLLPGIYTLKVKVLTVNGVVDDCPANDYLEKTITAGVTIAYRRVCIEHFTSSTCGPCVSVNTQMKNLLLNNPDKFGITKYQMNWPGSGDPYYTAEGGTRRTYYGVNAVPNVFFNGKDFAQSVNQTIFNDALNEPAFLDIAGTYSISGTNINVNFDISAYMATPEVRVHATVNEKITTGNVGGNGETEFHHVMMKMLPNAEGTSTTFNQGETKSFTFNQNMAGTHVEEMNDLEVHVFVQHYASKYIYNSKFLIESSIVFNPPTNLVLQNNGDGTVTATWNPPGIGGNPTYNIYLNGVLIKDNHTTTSYIATLPPPQIGYQAFKVIAVYGTNMSAPITGHILIDNNMPPTDLNLTQVGNDVVMTWIAPSAGADSYIVYYNGSIFRGGIAETTFTHINAPVGTHTYGVASVIRGAISEKIEKDITVVGCSAPKSLDAVQQDNDVVLTWVAPDDGADYYNVYLDGTLYKDNITATTYTLINVPVGEHVFGVTSVTGDCESTVVTKTLEVTGSDCPPPHSLDAAQEGSDVVLTWEAPEGEVDSYIIYLDGTLHQDNITETTYTFVAAPEGKHIYGVSAILDDCESEIVEIEFTTTTGISELEDGFMVYPNPTRGELKVESGDLRVESVEIFDVLGKKVFEQKENLTILRSYDLTVLPPGIYFVRIQTENNAVTRKIVKQ
jgi:hypothetical protein